MLQFNVKANDEINQQALEEARAKQAAERANRMSQHVIVLERNVSDWADVLKQSRKRLNREAKQARERELAFLALIPEGGTMTVAEFDAFRKAAEAQEVHISDMHPDLRDYLEAQEDE